MAGIKNTYKKKEEPIEEIPVAEKPVKEKKVATKSASSVVFWKDERFLKTAGILCILFGIYLAVAIISYLFTWRSDNSVIDGQGFGFIFSGDELKVENWLGKFGACTAHKFLKVWFGISSILFAFCARANIFG